MKFVHPFAVGKWRDVSKSNNNGSDDNNDDSNDDDKDSDDNNTEGKIQALKNAPSFNKTTYKGCNN